MSGSPMSKAIHGMGQAIWIPIIGAALGLTVFFERQYVRPSQSAPHEDFRSYRMVPIRDDTGKLLAYRRVMLKKEGVD